MLKPVQNLLEKPLNFFEKTDDPEAIDDFLTMEMWLNDNIPLAGEVYRELVKYLYQQNLPFNDLISSKDRKSVVVPAGHIGLATGGKAQREVWPQACQWLAERS